MSDSDRTFVGKVAIVTGATSGIGRATAERFAERGAAVIVAGRRMDKGQAVVDAIRARGSEATFVQTDVTSAKSVSKMVDETIRLYGRLDCAFNNAGVPGENFKNICEQSEKDWELVINTNLRGVWLSMKYELPWLQRRGGGAIVNTASIFAHAGSDFGIAPYVASKHGVLGLTRSAAIEFARDRVRVNAVSPGITRSEMTEPALRSAPDQVRANIERSVPLARIAEPSEVASAVVWLCSDEASFITGETLAVDGGWLSR